MIHSREEVKAIEMLLGAVYISSRGYFSRMVTGERFDEKTLAPVTEEEYTHRRKNASIGKPWYE